MGMIAIGTGSLTAGIFGMNLTNALEDHPYAFTLGIINSREE